MIQMCIINIDGSKLKIGLRTIGIVVNIWSISCTKPVILISANFEFVNSKIALIPDNKSKAQTLHIYKNNIFSFIYNVKTTIQIEFSNPDISDISNFCAEIKVVVKLQVHSRNFKIKR